MQKTGIPNLTRVKPVRRREMIHKTGIFVGALSLGTAPLFLSGKDLKEETGVSSKLRITNLEVFEVKASERTRWIFIRLRTNLGLTGLGEATIGRSFEAKELKDVFHLVRERSPFSPFPTPVRDLDILVYPEYF